MIAFIEGQLAKKCPTHAYILTGGVAYFVNISLYTFSKIENLQECRIYTYMHVTENSQSLYGFFDEEEKEIFVHLISVSGIGPNTARVIMSYMTPSEAQHAILNEDVVSFNKVKGVGPKTAKRIILDLKDKMVKLLGDDTIKVESSHNTIKEEALSALITLGFHKKSIEKVVDQALSTEDAPSEVEDLIKIVLKNLS